MNGESGFLELNSAGSWPSFQLDHLVIGPDGALILQGSPGGFTARGLIFGGPFSASSVSPWFRLIVDAEPLPAGVHLQLFTYTADVVPPAFAPAALDPFPAPDWRAAPRDVLDVLILNAMSDPPPRSLWVGGMIRSDGQATPTIRQMRAEYGRARYLDSLPAMFRRDDAQRDFLERFLALHESVLGGLEASISALPRLFDPAAAPGGALPSWLSWLAGWLAFDENGHWSEAEERRFLAEAFELYGHRGTVEGLRRYLEMYAGVHAHVEGPG